MLRSWAPFFIFFGPPFISQDIPCQPTPYPSPAIKSHGPKEYYVSSWTIALSFKADWLFQDLLSDQ